MNKNYRVLDGCHNCLHSFCFTSNEDDEYVYYCNLEKTLDKDVFYYSDWKDKNKLIARNKWMKENESVSVNGICDYIQTGENNVVP